MENRTYITEEDIVIDGFMNNYILEYTAVFIETINSDQDPSINAIDRTILVIDNVDQVSKEISLNHIYKIIENEKNLSEIHKKLGKVHEIEKFFPEVYLHLAAYTDKYWDDVRYFNSDHRTYLANDAFEFNNLQLKVLELVKQKFYHRDILVNICNEDNPNQESLNKAFAIIDEQKIDYSIALEDIVKQPYVKNYYEKLILKDELFEKMIINQNNSKSFKL